MRKIFLPNSSQPGGVSPPFCGKRIALESTKLDKRFRSFSLALYRDTKRNIFVLAMQTDSAWPDEHKRNKVKYFDTGTDLAGWLDQYDAKTEQAEFDVIANKICAAAEYYLTL